MSNYNDVYTLFRRYKESGLLIKNIPSNRAKNIFNKLDILEQEKIIAFLDTSIFSTGKNGIAFCEKGLYYRWSNYKKVFTWKEFAALRITINKRLFSQTLLPMKK